MREQDCNRYYWPMQVAIEQLQQELAVSRREEEATRERARKVLQAMGCTWSAWQQASHT